MEAAKYAAKATQLLELGPAITDLHWELRNRRLVAMSQKLSRYVKAGDASQQNCWIATQSLCQKALRLLT